MRFKIKGAVAIGAVLAMTVLIAGPASAGKKAVKAYNSIPKKVPGNVASVGFEATSMSEFGDEVQLLNTAPTHLANFTVVMSSWGCESGGASTNDCLTSTGATFNLPITLDIYQGNGATVNGAVPGDLLLTQTRTFKIKYRPSRNVTQCTGAQAGEWWSNKDHSCYNGLAQEIKFGFPQAQLVLPSDIVWTISYDTTHHGYAPIGESAPCYASDGGCGYDSLNVGSETIGSQPTVGTDVDPNGVFFNSSYAGFYCDGGASGVGLLRLDTDPGSCGWADYIPLATIKTR